jgi:hypothetical protein
MQRYYIPKTIVQYAEYPDNDISWTNNSSDTTIIDQPLYNFINTSNGVGGRNNIQTVKPLTHVANPSRGPKLDKTYYLKCTNFEITDVPSTVTGIGLVLQTQRNQKIVDDTICLIYQDQVISDNKTNLSAGPYAIDGHLRNSNNQTYGNVNDLWGATITPDMVRDPSFGVLLRFSSNPMYPHREGMTIFQVFLEVFPDAYFIEEFSDEDSIEFITEDDANAKYFQPG